MKEKILNILLTFFLFLLIFNFFLGSKTEQKIDNTIKLTADSSYTIPADLSINITNNTSSGITINTCDELVIKKDSKEIIKQDCGDVFIETSESVDIDFADQYKDFYDVGEYYILLNTNNKELISTFDVENKGFISKIFVFLFYAPIYNLMAFLLEITNYSLGFAIIIVTIIIRLLLVFPQHKMMVSQRKMQLIQPKIKELQDKYKKDQQTLGMELMKLYKEEGVNPMGSCGLLLIQMPILIVMYHVIVGIQSESNSYYLYSFLSDYDLHKIIDTFFGLHLFSVGGVNGLIIAITVGLLQFLQVKLSLTFNKNNNVNNKNVVIEKKPGTNDFQSMMPDPELMNKVMLYGMPVMIAFATYSFFAGVGLYWGIGAIFMIVQQIVVNKILKK